MRQVKVAMACLRRSLNFGGFFHTEVLSKQSAWMLRIRHMHGI